MILDNKINVPLNAIEGFLEIREMGVTNMFDSNTVLAYLYKLGYCDAAAWLIEMHGNEIRCNNKKYVALLNEVSEHLLISHTL